MAGRKRRADGGVMKSGKACAAMIALCLAGCVTIASQGEAVECEVCRTLWIKLYPESGSPGIYRLNHRVKQKPCAQCEAYASRYFETGDIPERCAGCGGRFALRPVEVTP